MTFHELDLVPAGQKMVAHIIWDSFAHICIAEEAPEFLLVC